MDLQLEDKVALVTASSAGLGLATAVELAKEGAKVVICGRSQERLDSALVMLKELTDDDKISGRLADVASPDDITALVQHTVNTFGDLDILVTNAGGPPAGSFEKTDLDAWDKTIQLTLMSNVRLIRDALPYLKESDTASVLTITSVSAKQPIGGLLLSNVLRPAVIGLTKTLSQELAPIRFNSILPGWTATDRVNELLTYNSQKSGRSVEDLIADRSQTIPLKRMADADEFGKVAAFLVSAAASYITGTMIQVDGGAYNGLL